MTDTTVTVRPIAETSATRWIQLGLGLVCMMAISSPQYVWTLFTKPLGAALSVSPGVAAGDLLPADRAADVLLAIPGMVGGQIRAETARSAPAACCPACPGYWPPTLPH